MGSDTPRGKHHRCGHTPYVGGVPTVDGEVVWRQGAKGPERVRSPKQLDGDETLVVLPAAAGRPQPGHFDGEGLPDGGWVGTSGPATMGRHGAGVDRRAATLARHPELAGRFRTAPLATSRPRFDPLDGSDQARTVLHLSAKVAAEGGTALLVGGAVRDAVVSSQRGTTVASKDFDVEVFGVEPGRFAQILVELGGSGTTHGHAFPVFVLGADVEVALPRRETKVGAGHTGFDVVADPGLPPERACLRRDLTINALMSDVLTGEVLDYVGGVDDLRDRRLRHVSPAFAEDPLRVLRAAQFAARFSLVADPATLELCRSLVGEASTLPPERVYDEFDKMLSKGERPGLGLELLAATGWDQVWPELAGAGPGAPAALDRWARRREGTDALVRGMAVLGRELDGDPATGGAMAASLVGSWGQRPRQAAAAGALVAHAAEVERVAAAPDDAAVRRLSAAAGGCVAACEVASARSPGAAERVEQAARRLGVWHAAPEPLVAGRDLVAAGERAGPAFGPALQAAYDAQLDGSVTDADGALALARSLLSKGR